MGLLQFAVEARHQCGVHLEQRAPGLGNVMWHGSTLPVLVRAHTL